MSTGHMAAASSDFDIFNLLDTDDIELSQLCEKMDTENNLINTADIFDIFNLFDDIELSQHCEKMDTENNSSNVLDYGVTTSITNWNVISLQLARIIEEGS